MKRRNSLPTTRNLIRRNSIRTSIGESHYFCACSRARLTSPIAMPVQILMPALSPTMEKGNLAKWLKKEGDSVKTGDVIAEIETDKATMEVEAIDDGTLGRILVPEGTNDVAVNTPIATILAEGEDKAALTDSKPAQGGVAKPAPAQRAPDATPAVGAEPAKAPPSEPAKTSVPGPARLV